MSICTETDSQALHITAELDEPLQALSERLALLHKTLSTATLYRIWRSVARTLQDLLWYQVIIHQRFTSNGGRQFYRDVTALLSLIDTYIPGASETVLGMPKIKESAILLSLPTTISRDSSGDTSTKGIFRSTTIDAAYDRVMRDNASAKAFVTDMAFLELDYAETRRIIERRIEVGE